jgi:putative DNA primase/helicase
MRSWPRLKKLPSGWPSHRSVLVAEVELPPDPFNEEETEAILAAFFGTDKPLLRANDPDLERISTEAWGVLRASNVDPVRIVRMGSTPCRIEVDDDGAPVVRPLTVSRLRQEMASRATWYAAKGTMDAVLAAIAGHSDDPDLRKMISATRPPREVIENMLAMPDISLPILERIVEAPVFAPDGTIETAPGYHATSRTFYSGRGLKLRPIPAHPQPTETDEAVDFIEELLQDFPFVSKADALIAYAAMFGPFVRSLIDGSTPLHLFEAPTPGTGKGLLADVVSIPATGRRAATITEARGEEEWRKRITAMLRNGRPMTLIDNVQARLESAALSAALTSPLWTDRLLGVTELVAYPVKTIWMATGNNPALSREIARRSVRCRMDAGVDHPELRSDFHHDLPAWAHERRADLVWAILVITQSWLANGRPAWSGVPLGSLESWCRTMGGICENVGLHGFLDNLEDFQAASDEESSMWAEFFAQWWRTYGDREVLATELFDMGRDSLDLGHGTTRAQQTTLGHLLARQRDRRYAVPGLGEVRVVRRNLVHGHRRWKLEMNAR